MSKKLWLPLTVGLVLTGFHLAYRIGSYEAPAGTVSTLSIGDRFPDLVSASLDDPTVPGPTIRTGRCQIVVAFSPSCPYCRSAAETESAMHRPESLPITWVTAENTDGTRQFRELVAPASRVRYAVDMVTQLEIQAVPASFLVTAGGKVAKRWVYQGDEDHSALAAQCEL